MELLEERGLDHFIEHKLRKPLPILKEMVTLNENRDIVFTFCLHT